MNVFSKFFKLINILHLNNCDCLLGLLTRDRFKRSLNKNQINFHLIILEKLLIPLLKHVVQGYEIISES